MKLTIHIDVVLRVRTSEAVSHYLLKATMAYARTRLPFNYYTSTFAYFRIIVHGPSVAAALQFFASVGLFVMVMGIRKVRRCGGLQQQNSY